jgi:hypothetical protein
VKEICWSLPAIRKLTAFPKNWTLKDFGFQEANEEYKLTPETQCEKSQPNSD